MFVTPLRLQGYAYMNGTINAIAVMTGKQIPFLRTGLYDFGYQPVAYDRFGHLRPVLTQRRDYWPPCTSDFVLHQNLDFVYFC